MPPGIRRVVAKALKQRSYHSQICETQRPIYHLPEERLTGYNSPMSAPRKGYFTASYVSSIDDSDQPFALWVPETYSRRKKYPLLIALHGSDADHRMIPESCFQIQERAFRDDILLLSPFGRGDLGFQFAGEADFWDTINWVKARYRIDERRQYLTGLSLGAFAVWRLASAYPEQWAAIAPVCGWGDPAWLARLTDIPVWCVHGSRDELVPVEDSRRMVAELERLEYRFRYDELPDWRHNSWEWLYNPNRKSDHLVDWLLRFRRHATPAPVLKPKREGNFFDLLKERVIISHPARGLTHHEPELLRAEAEELARLNFSGLEMRSGRLLIKSDAELTAADLANTNQIMFGRTDNHAWLKKAGPRLLARHVRGRLKVLEQAIPGKHILALTVQPSPWNSQRLLGTITYQQYHHVHHLVRTLFDPEAPLPALNVYDIQHRRFLLQGAAYNSSSRSA